MRAIAICLSNRILITKYVINRFVDQFSHFDSL